MMWGDEPRRPRYRPSTIAAVTYGIALAALFVLAAGADSITAWLVGMR